MDWQQTTALAIVGLTAFLFGWQLLRRPRLKLAKTGQCGCTTSSSTSNPSITFRARKNGVREIIVHAK